MRSSRFLSLVVLPLLSATATTAEPVRQSVTEKSFEAPGNVRVTVRMQAPYDVDTPMQVVCYFKHRQSGDKTYEAAIELDRRLGGIIASLRDRGEFVGDRLETLLLTPPEGTIKPKRLLLVGLGNEDTLSLHTLERVGKVSLRMAAVLGVKQVAFAPLLRDQGNSRFSAAEVGRAVTRGMLLAYDTDKRLQKENMAKPFTLEAWVEEAGQPYFADTVPGVQQGIADATARITARSRASDTIRR